MRTGSYLLLEKDHLSAGADRPDRRPANWGGSGWESTVDRTRVIRQHSAVRIRQVWRDRLLGDGHGKEGETAHRLLAFPHPGGRVSRAGQCLDPQAT